MNFSYSKPLWRGNLFSDNLNDEPILIILGHVATSHEFTVLRDVERTGHNGATRFVRSIFIKIRAGNVILKRAVIAEIRVGGRDFGNELVYVGHGVDAGVIGAPLECRRIVVLVQDLDRDVHVAVLRILPRVIAIFRIDVEIGIVGCEDGQEVAVPLFPIERPVSVDAAVRLVNVECSVCVACNI